MIGRRLEKCGNNVAAHAAILFRTLKKVAGRPMPRRGGGGKTTETLQENHFKLPLHLAVAGYLNYTVVFCFSWLRELILGIGPHRGTSMHRTKEGPSRVGYTPLYSSFECFYTRNVYRRLKQIFQNIIGSVPGEMVTFVERKSDDDGWTFRMDENDTRECINLSSYNYLGYAQVRGDCTESAVDTIHREGLSACSSWHELGSKPSVRQLESSVAKFVDQEDAIVVGMGYATNALNLSRILSKGDLAISDEYNHASLIQGLRLSGATIRVCKHNNMKNLETMLRNAIIRGRPRTHRPWRKIFIIVEGIYSMEGTICNLPKLIELKKKYGAYLYIDEAHSIGALGPNGRGVADYFGLKSSDIDLHMGTFTKSFGAAGGYIAGRKDLINFIRINSESNVYCNTISPPVAAQITTALKCLMSPEKDGHERVKRLARNTIYFRSRLEQLGFVVSGHKASPVVPIMIFMPSKVLAFVTKARDMGVATVGVGFPATKITEERIRFCLSAGHTKEMLDKVIDVIDHVGDYIKCKYAICSDQKDVEY